MLFTLTEDQVRNAGGDFLKMRNHGCDLSEAFQVTIGEVLWKNLGLSETLPHEANAIFLLLPKGKFPFDALFTGDGKFFLGMASNYTRVAKPKLRGFEFL